MNHVGRDDSNAAMADLIEGLREAAALLYNVTGRDKCFSLAATGPAAGNVGPWGECSKYINGSTHVHTGGYKPVELTFCIICFH